MVLPGNHLVYLAINLFPGKKEKKKGKKWTSSVSSPYYFVYELTEGWHFSILQTKLTKSDHYFGRIDISVLATARACSQPRLFPCPTISHNVARQKSELPLAKGLLACCQAPQLPAKHSHISGTYT